MGLLEEEEGIKCYRFSIPNLFQKKKKKIVDASIEDRNFEKEKERSEFAFLS